MPLVQKLKELICLMPLKHDQVCQFAKRVSENDDNTALEQM